MADSQPVAARRVPRVLSIAGTDPTGGAGIQADLKSVAAHGGYAMAVVTALVAQNTRGVRAVHTPPPAFLREQLHAVSDDVEIDAVKIGMLGDVATVAEVRTWLGAHRPPVVVLDPVMVATSGHRLLDADAEDAVRDLVPAADLVTPNLAELGVLVGAGTARSWAEALDQAHALSSSARVVVLAKGGHLDGTLCPDALVDASGALPGQVVEVTGRRVETRHSHGTGCSLSSAMATRRVLDGGWAEALSRCKAWLLGALEHADELHVGGGNGPVHHFHHVQELLLSPDAVLLGPLPALHTRSAPPPREDLA